MGILQSRWESTVGLARSCTASSSSSTSRPPTRQPEAREKTKPAGLGEGVCSAESEAEEGPNAKRQFLEAELASPEVQLSASNYPFKPHQQEPAFAGPQPLSTNQEFGIPGTNAPNS